MDRKRYRVAFRRTAARVAMKSTLGLVKILPIKSIYPIGDILGILGFFFARRHRRVALESLKIAFEGQLKEDEIFRIAKGSFRNMAQSGLEMLVLLHRCGWASKVVRIEGRENLDKALLEGKGVIGLTAHFGNFPLLGVRLVLERYKVAFIMRKMRDEKIDEFFHQKRTQMGLVSILTQPRKECIRKSLDWLRKNNILIIQMDQNFGSGKGVFVDFFGKKAATATGPVLFALRTQAKILPMFIIRQKDNTHRLIIDPPVELSEGGVDPKQKVYFNVAKMTKIIEYYVRQHPEQWGWIHRRWKSRPSEKDEEGFD